MSRTPASYGMTLVRGTTWSDFFDYADADDVPVDLSTYSARLQVHAIENEWGSAAPLLELSTADGTLRIVTPAGGTVANRVELPELAASVHAALNPDNARRVKYAYALELQGPAAGADPGLVIPLVRGKLTVQGWGVR